MIYQVKSQNIELNMQQDLNYIFKMHRNYTQESQTQSFKRTRIMTVLFIPMQPEPNKVLDT